MQAKQEHAAKSCRGATQAGHVETLNKEQEEDTVSSEIMTGEHGVVVVLDGCWRGMVASIA